MNISHAAVQSGLPVKTLRYYEEIGLVSPKRTVGNDYRVYSPEDIDHLRFLQRARAVGFNLGVCRELLDLYRDPHRRCSQVKALVTEKIQQVETQLQELNVLRSTLVEMANSCAGDESSHCNIIDALAQPPLTGMSFTLVEPDHE
ncbi:MAG: MerR family transcriptional regulator [Moraxellaceae bacterium]|nr:MAG: MerR family transcriptional regulator [Moraxellaceae bacterium]